MSSTKSRKSKQRQKKAKAPIMDETYHKEKLKRIIIGAYQPINAILTMIREYTFTAAYDEATLI